MVALSELRSARSGPPVVNLAVEAGGPDDALVRAAQRGDRSAFGLLYSRYSRMVHGILFARVPFTDVDDLVQDVFLQALPRLNAPTDPARSEQLERYFQKASARLFASSKKLNENPHISAPYLTQAPSTPKIEVSP